MLELPAWWYEDDEWRGFVLRDQRNDLLGRHVFATWLAGFSHRTEAACQPCFDPGKPLSLVAEPDNPHDPNAVAVFDAERTEQCGYVPQVVAGKMAPRDQRFGVSLAEHLADGERVGLVIAVSREPITVRSVPIRPEETRRVRREVRRSKEQFREMVERVTERMRHLAEDPVEQMRRMLEGFGPRPGEP
jgi:HIRAN domain